MTVINTTSDFQFRPAVLDDLEEIYQLERRISESYYGVEGMTLDRIRKEYLTPGFTLEDSVRLAFNPHNHLVGLMEVWDTVNPPVHPYLWMRIDPAYEQAGLQAQLLEWAEQRACRVLDQVDAGVRVSLRAPADHLIDSAGNSFQEAGMEMIRHSFRMRIEMAVPPPLPTWPEGIQLRGYNPEQDAYAVYQVDDEVFQDHYGYIPEDSQIGYEKFIHHMTGDDSYDPSLWFLAVAGEEIAGICLCRTRGYDEPDAGYISSLGVRRPWRRQGIALALLQQAFGAFYRRGYRKVDLGVDAGNLTGALDLYKKAGMFVFRQFDLYEKELRSGREISVVRL